MKTKKSRPRWRILVDILLVVVVFLGVRAWMQRGTVSGEAPEIKGRLTTGESVSLSDMRGTPVIVHFWATWCPVCKREEGSIASIAEEYPVLTVATGCGDLAEVRRYLASRSVAFPTIVDPDGRIAARYGVRALPTTFVVGPEGQIRFTETGYTTEVGLRVRRWLAE